MDAPCKDCPDRVVGCHATCERYIAYDEQRKAIRAQKLMAQIIRLPGRSFTAAMRDKEQRSKHGRGILPWKRDD